MREEPHCIEVQQASVVSYIVGLEQLQCTKSKNDHWHCEWSQFSIAIIILLTPVNNICCDGVHCKCWSVQLFLFFTHAGEFYNCLWHTDSQQDLGYSGGQFLLEFWFQSLRVSLQEGVIDVYNYVPVCTYTSPTCISMWLSCDIHHYVTLWYFPSCDLPHHVTLSNFLVPGCSSSSDTKFWQVNQLLGDRTVKSVTLILYLLLVHV